MAFALCCGFILPDRLLTVSEKAAECTVYINGSDKKQIALRCCAIKKTKEEIQAEEKRLKGLESKKQKNQGKFGSVEKPCCSFLRKNILEILIFPPLGTSEENRSIWRETKLTSFIIFMMVLPNKAAMSVDVLELIKMSFIEKRKSPRQQFIRFLLS